MLGKILGDLGANIGKFFGGGVLSKAGRFIGNWIGDKIEEENNHKEFYSIGRQKNYFFPVSDANSKVIPIIFGKTRVNGELIWSDIVKEIPNTESVVKYFKHHKSTYTRTEFSYTCSFAIGICEGEIDYIERVWCNGELLDLELFEHRIYKGSESQEPDSLISEVRLGKEVTAFRGLAYIVFKDFPLDDFGGRVPRFDFEVSRSLKNDVSLTRIENKVRAINIIPGSGEYVYDTIIQSKNVKLVDGAGEIIKRINSNNAENIADSVFSLNYLEEICPKLQWTAPVICWFGDSLDIGKCNIFPAIEHKNTETTYSEEWRVAGISRERAREISREKGTLNIPTYGGTVSDNSILRYLREMKKRGYKIMFYPMIFLDVPGKPWRGHMTGSPEDVSNFFRKENGYNRFILHYANLVKDDVDAFLIGSELKSITKINSVGFFPAVRELEALAVEVKAIVGSKVKVSYAADWSEYHHTDGGFYHLDSLWASDAIDFVGIDNYMPLTEIKDGQVSANDIKAGFESGEGYDFYYNGDKKMPLDAPYAWKNLKWWWENYHTNPNGERTKWIPKSKKIWFTEYGFPSVNKATNQPNVFFDPNCSDGGLPKYSNGATDFAIQKAAISEFLDFWGSQEYIENMFLWCFDARPYPKWPHSKIWRDSYLWEKGHWINGKFGSLNLGEILKDILKRLKIDEQFDSSTLYQQIYGLEIARNANYLEIISLLRSVYFFDIYAENNGSITFRDNNLSIIHEVPNDHLLLHNNENSFMKSEIRELDLIGRIFIKFKNILLDYEIDTDSYFSDYSTITKVLYIPLSLSNNDARTIAENIVNEVFYNKNQLFIELSLHYLYLKPGDIIALKIGEKILDLKIKKIDIYQSRISLETTIINHFEYKILDSALGQEKQDDSGFIIKQIILNSGVESSGKTILEFINSSRRRKPLLISNDGEKFYKIADLDGGSIVAKVVSSKFSESISYRLIDERSYIDILFEDYDLENRILNLKSQNSRVMIGQNLLHVGMITRISDSIYRLSKFIHKKPKDGAGTYIPKDGDDVIFLDQINKIETDESIKGSVIYYKNGESIETIIL